MFVVICDAEGRILHASAEFAELTGWRPAAGEPLSRFVTDADLTGVTSENPLPATLHGPGGTPVRIVLRAARMNYGTGTVTAFVGERLTTPLPRSMMFLDRATLNTIEGAILIEDRDGIVLFANQKLLELLEYPEPELIGRHWSLVVPHEERRWVEQQLRVRRRGERNQYETVLLTRTGRRIPVIVSARPLYEQGEYAGAVATFIDITERKQIEYELRASTERMEQLNNTLNRQRAQLLELTDELARANEELQRLSQAKSDFVAAVSHDLRSPLTTIREGVALVADGTLGPVNEEQVKFLTMAIEDTERLNDFICDILDLSKIEAGKLTVNKTRVNIAEELRRVQRSYERYAADKGLNLTVELPDERLAAFCDASHYSRVVMNLLSNAIKYTEPGGRITISVTQARDQQLLTAVTDTGIGIPADQQHLIFGKYDMVKRSTPHRRPGSGLGLSLCKQLVELNGGKIGFESQEGKGSRFFFALPAYDELRELAYIVESVAEHARTIGQPTAVFLFAPTGVDDRGETLKSVQAQLQPQISVFDQLRCFPEQQLLFYVSGQSDEQAEARFAQWRTQLAEQFAGTVAAAFALFSDPLPSASALLASLKKRLKPIGPQKGK